MSLFDRINGGPQMTVQQIQQDPVGMGKQAGYNIPQEIANNPQAMVKHLIQTGQIGGPMMQKIAPMIQRLGGIK